MEEIVSQRTATSKSFNVGDGRILVQIGKYRHHQKNGQWVDTDTNWDEDTTKFKVKEYPYPIEINKSTRTVSVTFGDQTITLSPNNAKVPSVSRSGNKVTLVGLWRGITLEAFLNPDGLFMSYYRTSDNYDNPSWTFTGPFVDCTKQLEWKDEKGIPTTVPRTINNGVVTWDFSNVPLNKECN